MNMEPLVHPAALPQIDAILVAKSGSYVLHGPQSVGKATIARDIARRLNCLGDDNGPCANCRQLAAGNYPDFILVQPEDKPSIIIDQVRRVIQALSLSLYRANGVRTVLIDGAEAMTIEAQNALLKLIEEPPPQTLFLLVTQTLEALLPTVRSRCLQIYLSPLHQDQIAVRLVHGHGLDKATASELASLSEGSPGRAISLATDPDQATARAELAALAATAPAQPLFDRLLLAGRLISVKADLDQFGRFLQADIVRQLHADTAVPQAVTRQLEALSRFRDHLQAKVSPRVALESLLMEL